MRSIAKALLWLVTSIVPVFIAACYGATEYYYGYGGRAVDRKTGKGIDNLKVTCVVSNGPVDWNGDTVLTGGGGTGWD